MFGINNCEVRHYINKPDYDNIMCQKSKKRYIRMIYKITIIYIMYM